MDLGRFLACITPPSLRLVGVQTAEEEEEEVCVCVCVCHRRKRVTIRQHTGSVLSLLYGIRRDIVVHGYRSYVIYVTLDTVLYREVRV